MFKKSIFSALLIITTLFYIGAFGASKAHMQTPRTLVGRWIMRSSPINGEQVSRKGNTLGFPDRDMRFEENGEIRTGFVDREDVGNDVKPLGVWRMEGNNISATFQLWCPDSNLACGSVVVRGEFVNDNRIRGTMTAFFDVEDDTRPTGFDTWPFSFVGDRVQEGGN